MGFAKILLLILMGSLWTCQGQGTLTITFEGPPLPTSARYILTPTYQEAGMRFSGADSHGNQGIEHVGAAFFPNYPYNGTSYLQASQFGYVPIYCSPDPSTYGPEFGVFSIDLAAWSASLPDFDVYFNASRSDGAFLSARASGSGLDFQTFYFGAEWSWGLSYLEIGLLSNGFALDNLVVIIPEPASGALFALGALTFASWRSRRRKRQWGRV